MATRIPAKFLGLKNEIGSLKEGQKANMVLLDERFNVTPVWIDGNQVI